MRDLYKSIDYIERGLLRRGLDRKATPPPPTSLEKPSKLSIRGWRAPVSAVDVVYPEQVFRQKPKPRDPPNDTPKDTAMAQLNLTARALKITVPLDVAEVDALPDPGGQARSSWPSPATGRFTAPTSPRSRCARPRR
jgi:hypothetical protein